MKLFWLIILALAVLAGVLVWQRTSTPGGTGLPLRGSDAASSPASGMTAAAQPVRPVGMNPTDAPTPAPAPIVSPSTATTANADTTQTRPTPAPLPEQAAAPAEADVAVTPAVPAESPAATPLTIPDASAISRELDQLLGHADADFAKPAPAASVASPASTDTATSPDTGAPSAPGSPRITQRDDGSILLDDRFIVRGKGTEADPYRLPWELLVSAQETYAPRKGLKKMPSRLTMFDNTHVRISGFIAFPITSTSPREMLVMLGQWDGCCIGIPPTAYDAIEVRLASAPTPAQRTSTQGTLRGVLKIDPLEDAGWLLGLYVIDNGKLSVEE